MERLQVTIEKARAQQEDSGTPNIIAAPDSIGTVLTEAVWMALLEFKLHSGLLHHKRVVAFESGPAAATYDISRTQLVQQA